jgi:hypothetical protein
MTRIPPLLVVAFLGSCSNENESSSRARLVSLSQSPSKADSAKAVRASPRKIVRTFEASLRVEDGDKFLAAVDSIAHDRGGYTEDRAVERDTAGHPAGTIQLRVPSEALDATASALRTLGTVESETLKADDITEQYADADARIHNQQQLEARLLALLAERAGNLAAAVEVESKLASVRETIEQLQGQQRRSDTDVSYAAVTLKFHVSPAFVAAGFQQEMSATFVGSCRALVGFGRGVALLGAALLPWLPAIGLLLLPMWWSMRRKVAAAKLTP